MAAKKTYIYEVTMTKSDNKDYVKLTYFYGRNTASVTKYCEEKYRPEFKYDGFQCVRVGDCHVTMEEPVIEFSREEIERIRQQLYPPIGDDMIGNQEGTN